MCERYSSSQRIGIRIREKLLVKSQTGPTERGGAARGGGGGGLGECECVSARQLGGPGAWYPEKILNLSLRTRNLEAPGFKSRFKATLCKYPTNLPPTSWDF